MILTFEHAEVRELRLNRPPVNALSPELIEALLRAVEAAPQDGVRALVLSGSPGIFSAGLDVPVLLRLDRPSMEAVWRDFYALMTALAASPIPIAAAITGHAPAGGTVLALFCDWRVATEGDWKIGLSEVQVGLPLPPVILSALRRVVGAREAERLAVGGLLMSPVEAAALRLVDEVVPAERVVDRAYSSVHILRIASESDRPDQLATGDDVVPSVIFVRVSFKDGIRGEVQLRDEGLVTGAATRKWMCWQMRPG
jgi:Delta3-Delta2-enoyl-CoA isomerase